MQLQGKIPPCDAVVMESLSDKYGWTPNQIRDMRVDDIQNYLDIISIKNKLTKKK